MKRAAFSENLLKTDRNRKSNLKFYPIVLLTIFLLGITPGNITLADDLQLNDNHLFDYATYLYKNGEYYRAITEYKRLIFFFPKSQWNDAAELQIGRSYMAGGRLNDAITYWETRLDTGNLKDDKLNNIRLLLGISLLDLDQTDIFKFREANIDKALKLFNKLDSEFPESRYFKDFSREWQNRNLDKKTPWLAGTLSAIIPGAGSFYTGRYLEGTYAFFLTGLFYLATRDAITNKDNELSILFGLLTVSFYGGSIYTAVNGAHKLNNKIESDELLRLREKHGIWFIPETERYPGRY